MSNYVVEAERIRTFLFLKTSQTNLYTHLPGTDAHNISHARVRLNNWIIFSYSMLLFDEKRREKCVCVCLASQKISFDE